MKIEILHPWLLAIIPVLLLFFIGSTRFFKVKQSRTLIKSLIFHGLTGSFLILALSGIRVKWVSKTITTVYVADLSDSTRLYRDKIQDFIKDSILQMPPDQYAGIVTFGSDTKLEQFVSEKRIFSKFDTVPLGTGTNMEEAVSVALSLLKEDTAKRIVLLTDGMENAGSLENMVSSVLAGNIDFKAVRLEKNNQSEAYVNNLEIPAKINIGDQFSIKIDIVSNKNMGAVLYLYSGQTLKAQQKVELHSGSNQFIFKDIQEEGGLKTYRVVMDADEDTESVNNEYSAYTNVQAPPHILVVEGRVGAAGEFVKLLDAVNVHYTLVTPEGTPETMNQMLEYKSIILADVYGGDLKKGFLDSIEAYVKDYGGGLIAIGGKNSFALGNYKDTPLETVLPVYMDLQGEKEIPPLSFLLVIDKSGSMRDGNGYVTNLDLAKQAAVKALENLREIDRIGVLSFDDSYTWANHLVLAEDKDEITRNIMEIPLGGGTSIYPALKAAADELKADNGKLKHIILLTDGQDGYSNYSDLIKELDSNGITLSTVSIGGEADVDLLQDLAKKGSGRYFHTDINTDIPRIFAQEVFLSVKSYLVNREFTPLITGNHEILEPLLPEGLPSMYGYIASTKKEFAQSLLVSDEKEPILTVWQYGLGKTAAFNSDVENIWTADYAGWEPYSHLWKNIIDYTVTDGNSEGRSVRVEDRGSLAEIIYQTDEYSVNSSVMAVYTYEDGSTGEIPLLPKSPGIYSGEIQTSQTGVYSLNVRQEEDGEVIGSQNTAYVMQYSREYRFAEDTFALDNFVKYVKGAFITLPEEVFSGKINAVKSRFPLTMLWLFFALFFFMTDIIQRRLQLKSGLKEKAEDRLNLFQETNQRKKEERKRQGRTALEGGHTGDEKGKEDSGGMLNTKELLSRKKEWDDR